MVRRLLAVSVLVLMTASAHAAAPSSEISGLFLTTRYPALTVRAGETTTLDLALHNYKLPPQSLTLSVPEVAAGWKATILGGGQPVGAVEVAPNNEEDLQLRLEPPASAAQGDYHFTVEARNANYDQKLPITVTVGKQVPARLKLTTDFPALRGTSSTDFKYKVTVTNDSGHDATINLAANAPKNFQVTFTQAYETQQIASIPIKAGQSKDIDAAVALPHQIPAGTYKLVLHAKTDVTGADLPLTLTVLGQPQLAVTGEGGRLSGEAYAGQSSQLTIVLRNDGSEAAHDVKLSASTPEGWKSSFDPKYVPQIAPGGRQSVKMTLTPSERAIAGDYQMTVTGDGDNGLTDSANFRITVMTSTLWGAIGIAIIAIALLVVVFAVARFGRR